MSNEKGDVGGRIYENVLMLPQQRRANYFSYITNCRRKGGTVLYVLLLILTEARNEIDMCFLEMLTHLELAVHNGLYSY